MNYYDIIFTTLINFYVVFKEQTGKRYAFWDVPLAEVNCSNHTFSKQLPVFTSCEQSDLCKVSLPF